MRNWSLTNKKTTTFLGLLIAAISCIATCYGVFFDNNSQNTANSIDNENRKVDSTKIEDSNNDLFISKKEVKKRKRENYTNQERYYNVLLVIPSRMSSAEIFVDEYPAEIIKQTLIVITIRVRKKEKSHQITLKMNNEICKKEIVIRQNNLRIQPCQ